jgi:hypothetical protein
VDKYDGLKKIKGNGSGCIAALCRYILRETGKKPRNTQPG